MQISGKHSSRLDLPIQKDNEEHRKTTCLIGWMCRRSDSPDVVAVKKLVVDGQARGVDPDRPSFCCCLLLFFLSKKRQQAAAKRVVFWHYSVLNISRKLG
jgi:hypothetical protein